MSESVWRMVISRALGAVAAVGAAVALVGLTTGSWATCTFFGSASDAAPDRSRHMELELFPDGRLTVQYGDERLRHLYDAGDNTAMRAALSHAVPGMLDGFAISCVVVVGLLAAVGIFRRLPSYLWTVACAVAMGGLTAVAVLRFQVLSALATYSAQMNLFPEVHGQPLADRTTAALVVFLVAAAACAHPLLRGPTDAAASDERGRA